MARQKSEKAYRSALIMQLRLLTLVNDRGRGLTTSEPLPFVSPRLTRNPLFILLLSFSGCA